MRSLSILASLEMLKDGFSGEGAKMRRKEEEGGKGGKRRRREEEGDMRWYDMVKNEKCDNKRQR